jgi:hypothetical protein
MVSRGFRAALQNNVDDQTAYQAKVQLTREAYNVLQPGGARHHRQHFGALSFAVDNAFSDLDYEPRMTRGLGGFHFLRAVAAQGTRNAETGGCCRAARRSRSPIGHPAARTPFP